MTIKLTPCPFCEGPPVPSVAHAVGGGHITNAALNAEDGVYATAHVFCHECGAKGPHVEDAVYSRSECDDLEAQAVQLWQERTAKNRNLYDGGEERGLNEYPREN